MWLDAMPAEHISARCTVRSRSSLTAASMPVRVTPGAIALTRFPAAEFQGRRAGQAVHPVLGRDVGTVVRPSGGADIETC